MPKKIITLDTLSEFKDKCDLTYAPIGGGGSGTNFIPVLELSNISGTTATIATPIPLPSTNNTRFFCYLTVPANVSKILTITVTDATSGSTATVSVATQYLDHMRNSFPMPFMILNNNGTLVGRVWENDTLATPIPLFYVKNGKITDQIDIGRLLDRQGVNTGVWFYIIGTLTQAYSIQFAAGADMWNKNGATSISFANTQPLTRLAGDKPTLVHLYKNSSVADSEGRYPHTMWYYDDKESTDGAAVYAISSMHGSTAVINHDLDIKPFSLADGTVVYIENYIYEGSVTVDEINFNNTTVTCYDAAGESTASITFEYGVPTPVLICEISVGSYIARPLGSASGGTVYDFDYGSLSRIVALDGTGSDMDGTPIPWLRADGTRLTPIVARSDDSIWVDSSGFVVAQVNAGPDLLNNNQYIGGTFISQRPNDQFLSFGRWQLEWHSGNQNWSVKLYPAINSQTINLDMNSVISII